MNQPNEMKHSPGFKAAGALIAYFGKKGNVTGHFDIAEMAEVINEQTAAPQLLEALQDALWALEHQKMTDDGQTMHGNAIKQARAALTLATTK